jgi:hypothetical protein
MHCLEEKQPKSSKSIPKGSASERIVCGITHNLFQGGGVESLFLKGVLFHFHRLGQEFNAK